MRYRDVETEVDRVLGALTWPGPDHSLTVIRDLEGRVRIMVESPTAGSEPDPEQAERERLKNALYASLGDWLGEHTPVWQAPAERDAALVALIRQERRPSPTPGGNAWTCFRLDRHAGRHGWVGDVRHVPPWSVGDVDLGLRPPVAVFFSQKGGVGRTTALAATAIHIAREGNKVLVLDLDLEAPGVGELFLDLQPTDAGVLDLLVGPPSATQGEARLAAMAVTDAGIVGTAGGSILVVPAGYVDPTYVQMLARVDLHGARAAAEVTARIAAVLRELCDEHAPDLVLIDARAGFHDVGGVALASLCHGAVFVGISNPQSWHGLSAVARVLRAAGEDGDGDPVAWLQVVHGLASPQVSPVEERAFRTVAYDTLSSSWYSVGRVPAEEAEEVAHDVVVIRWQSELRGQGGKLDSAVADRLAGEGYRKLAERLARWHASLRWGAS